MNNIERPSNAVKPLVESLLIIFDTVKEHYADDGKLDFWEKGDIALVFAKQFPKISSNVAEFWDSFKNLSDIERQELKLHFKDNFDLENNTTEEKIEAMFNWIVTCIPETVKAYTIISKTTPKE